MWLLCVSVCDVVYPGRHDKKDGASSGSHLKTI